MAFRYQIRRVESPTIDNVEIDAYRFILTVDESTLQNKVIIVL